MLSKDANRLKTEIGIQVNILIILYKTKIRQDLLERLTIQLVCPVPEDSSNTDYFRFSSSISFVLSYSSAAKRTLKPTTEKLIENRWHLKKLSASYEASESFEQAGHHVKWVVHEEGLTSQAWWKVPPIGHVQASDPMPVQLHFASKSRVHIINLHLVPDRYRIFNNTQKQSLWEIYHFGLYTRTRNLNWKNPQI